VAVELPRWANSTPGRLRLQFTAIAVAAASVLVIGCGVLIAVQVTVAGVQQRTVTAIVGVQRAHAWLAAADRSAANAYLSGSGDLTLPQLQYQADIEAASRELEQAAERNVAGPQASQLLQSVSQSLTEYTRRVDTASVEGRLGRSSDGVVALRSASDLMHRPRDGILARLEAISDRYAAELARVDLTLKVSKDALAVFAAAIGFQLTLLLYTQRFVRFRFRRRWNRRLLSSTLLAVVLAAGTGAGAVAAGQSIAASQEQYGRLLKLWHARSLVYDANGNHSLFLILGGAAGAGFDSAFEDETRQLVDRPLTDDLVAAAAEGDVRFGGLLADELRAGGGPERAAALKALRAYRQFLGVDASVRSAQLAGRHTAAVTLTLGDNSVRLGSALTSLDWGTSLGAQRYWSYGQLGFVFTEFDWNLEQLTQMLQDQFDATIARVQAIVGGMLGLQLLSVGAAALAYAGLRPRIREYEV
jgi:hypothetical protein